MMPIARALKTLEEQTGFSRSFIRTTEQSENWPNKWLTPQQINDELTSRGFWSRSRRGVHVNAHVRLVTHYLDEQVLKAANVGGPGGWQRFDGQYKLNPQSKLLFDPSKQKRSAGSQRAEARTPVLGIKCQYGPITEMSRTGLRFRSEQEADFMTGQKGFIRLTCGRLTVKVKVKILWMDDGVEGLMVGADFRRIEPEQRMLLDEIFQLGCSLAGNDQAA